MFEMLYMNVIGVLHDSSFLAVTYKFLKVISGYFPGTLPGRLPTHYISGT